MSNNKFSSNYYQLNNSVEEFKSFGEANAGSSYKNFISEETQIIDSLPLDKATGAVSYPIYQTSTFVQESLEVNSGYKYSRSSNPTRNALEELLNKLESGYRAFAFASGLAAIDAVAKLFKSGDEIIAVNDIYGGTYRLFDKVYAKFGIKVHFVDTSDLKNIEDNINENTKAIWLESPTNPTLKISDIRAISEISKRINALLIVDNTFATPVSQKPLLLGADIIIHSVTKYLAGHCDVTAGAVIVNSKELGEEIAYIQNATGGILAPFESWLTIRGIETLHLRFERHNLNAQKIAEFLEANNKFVDKVYYPGLESHPNHEIAKKQQKYFGGMVSFTIAKEYSNYINEFLQNTNLFYLAESLGGVKSLICYPKEMTHKSTPKELREAVGVTDNLIRLSVGLEHYEDLIKDLENAFNILNTIVVKRE